MWRKDLPGSRRSIHRPVMAGPLCRLQEGSECRRNLRTYEHCLDWAVNPGECQTMPADSPLDTASLRLQQAIERLDKAVDGQLERESIVREAEEEVQRMTADRGRLAGELDSALAKSERLEHANREVSRRLVGAMETIRTVLERRQEG